ncbi:hypothetical protein ACFCV3_04170 [Kribbella sp. NPDC056345]|uniref:hypothetical protein n=1 Tax=Kribbella sp. NPDC056345 TaxID=3345789 RepID=UPI0035E26C13
MSPSKPPATAGIALLVAVVLGLTACSKIPGYDPSAPTTYTTNRPITQPATVDTRPTAPPAPEPTVAKIGESIEVAELGNVKLSSYDPPQWARATITVTSFKKLTTVPGIPVRFKPGPHTVYGRVDIRTKITADPFTLWDQHFTLVAPDGTTYPQDANVAYLDDEFRNVTDSKTSDTPKNPRRRRSPLPDPRPRPPHRHQTHRRTLEGPPLQLATHLTWAMSGRCQYGVRGGRNRCWHEQSSEEVFSSGGVHRGAGGDGGAGGRERRTGWSAGGAGGDAVVCRRRVRRDPGAGERPAG